MFVVAGDGGERLGGGLKQEVVNSGFVVESDGGDLLRQREQDVEVFHRQQLFFSGLEPLRAGQRLAFRAMAIAARLVDEAAVLALAAFLEVAAERRGAALLDGAHGAMLLHGQLLSGAVILAVEPKDVSQLEGWRSHQRFFLLRCCASAVSSGLVVVTSRLLETRV